jgi:oxygen-independent coproporphyrinogen-3 oxidase
MRTLICFGWKRSSKVHGVYISFPFCRQKCTYCNFASGVFSDALQASYVGALEREIRSAERLEFDTLYMGGGTPSLLAGPELAQLTEALAPKSLKEFTMEAAPGDLSAEKAEQWAHLGVNRVSFGVQSFNEKVARSSGRKHTAQTVVDEVGLLRSVGIERINVDLISGLAWQTPATWAEEFDWIERLDLRHVSVYMLESDDESRLGSELRQGGSRYGASEVPSDDQIAEFYLTAVDRLRGLGIERYEISNFAAAGQESLHNQKYWTLQPYIGFGADAHSFDGSRRWGNSRHPSDYVRLSDSGESVRSSEELLDEDRRTDDLLMTGLRTREGVTLSVGTANRLAPQIAKLSEVGWLEQPTPNQLRLTDTGVMYSNEALQELLF